MNMRRASLLIVFFAISCPARLFALAGCRDNFRYKLVLYANTPLELSSNFVLLPDRKAYSLSNKNSEPIYLLSEDLEDYKWYGEALEKNKNLVKSKTGKYRIRKFVDGAHFIFDFKNAKWNRKQDAVSCAQCDEPLWDDSREYIFEADQISRSMNPELNKGASNEFEKKPKSVTKRVYIGNDDNDFSVDLEISYVLNENFLKQKSCEDGRPNELSTMYLNEKSKSTKKRFIENDLKRLAQVSTYLKQNSKMNIQIEGHVPKSKNIERDFELSNEIALRAKEILIKNGITKNRLEIIAYAGEKPDIFPAESNKNLRLEFTPLPW